MDAIDTNYQNIPNVQENKSVESIDKEEEFIIAGEAIEGDGIDSSFECLMDSIFDKVMQETGVKEVSDEAVSLSGIDVVDEDVNSMIELLSKENGKIVKKDEVSKTVKPFVDNQEITAEVPFVEIEMDATPIKKEDKKETKSIKGKMDAKIEEKKDDRKVVMSVKDEDVGIKNLNLVKHRKSENVQKPNIKKEEISKEDSPIEVGAVSTAQKISKPKMKKLPIVVQDLRTNEESNIVEEGASGGDTSSGDFSSHYNGESLNDVKSAKERSSTTENVATTKEGSFSSILAEQIKASSAELVERGKILLKNGNVGEIRLQLKPEHLGSVRIELKLSGDKKMQGEVTVSSKDAYEAFEDSLGELVVAFKDAGFDTSSFNLNWKNRGNEEIVREDLTDQYFSPEKTHQSLSEKLNLTENIYRFGQAENLNILA